MVRAPSLTGSRQVYIQEVIDDCQKFSPALIKLALSEIYGIPHGEAKGIVLYHPICGEGRRQWRELNEILSKIFLEQPGEESGKSGELHERKRH